MFTVLNDLRPYALILVGLPGSGKSTFISTLPEYFQVLSTDNIIQAFAIECGISYNTAFHSFGMNEAERIFNADFNETLRQRLDFVIDQTNVSVKVRARKLARIPKEYHKVAVVFTLPDDVLAARLAKRAEEDAKFIPPHVLTDMRSRFEMPTKAEGFDEVINFSL